MESVRGEMGSSKEAVFHYIVSKKSFNEFRYALKRIQSEPNRTKLH